MPLQEVRPSCVCVRFAFRSPLHVQTNLRVLFSVRQRFKSPQPRARCYHETASLINRSATLFCMTETLLSFHRGKGTLVSGGCHHHHHLVQNSNMRMSSRGNVLRFFTAVFRCIQDQNSVWFPHLKHSNAIAGEGVGTENSSRQSTPANLACYNVQRHACQTTPQTTKPPKSFRVPRSRILNTGDPPASPTTTPRTTLHCCTIP